MDKQQCWNPETKFDVVITQEDREWLSESNNPYIFFDEGKGELKRGWYFWDIHKCSYRAEPLPTLEAILLSHQIYVVEYDRRGKREVAKAWDLLNQKMLYYEKHGTS